MWCEEPKENMIGIHLVASGKNKGAIKRAHNMQEIANFNIGYAFISTTKRLEYKMGEEAMLV